MRKVRIGVVGLGGIAQKAYLPILSRETDWQLVGAFSPGVEKRQRICRQYRMGDFTSLQALANECDAVFVHSSTPTHFEVVSGLLNKGIAVYVDKPLAQTVKEAEELYRLSRINRSKLMVGFNRRFAPMYVEAKKQIQKLTWMSFEKHRSNAIGPETYDFTLLDDYIHIVDTARWIAGGDLQIKYSNLQVNKDKQLNSAQHMFESLEGTSFHTAMHRYAGSNLEQLTLYTDGSTIRVKNMQTKEIEENGVATIETASSWDTILKQRGFEGAVNHFIRAIYKDEQPVVDGEEGLKTQLFLNTLISEGNI